MNRRHYAFALHPDSFAWLYFSLLSFLTEKFERKSKSRSQGAWYFCQLWWGIARISSLNLSERRLCLQPKSPRIFADKQTNKQTIFCQKWRGGLLITNTDSGKRLCSINARGSCCVFADMSVFQICSKTTCPGEAVWISEKTSNCDWLNTRYEYWFDDCLQSIHHSKNAKFIQFYNQY